jgi:hypothetical protein
VVHGEKYFAGFNYYYVGAGGARKRSGDRLQASHGP